MSVEFNHTIIQVRDNHESAMFVAEILGLPQPEEHGGFTIVRTSNNVSLDFMTTDEEIAIQHYAFLVSKDKFSAICERIKTKGIPYWADPMASRSGEIYIEDGLIGIYFCEPSGHYLEAFAQS